MAFGSWWGDDRYLVFADKGYDNSLWGALLEKAGAKFLGTYATMSGGLTE